MIRAREHGGLAVLLLATAVLYVWDLGASDAANAITVDKTPAALWV